MEIEPLQFAASACAFLSATFLAYHKKEGWGWLIFAGILVAGA